MHRSIDRAMIARQKGKQSNKVLNTREQIVRQEEEEEAKAPKLKLCVTDCVVDCAFFMMCDAMRSIHQKP